MALQSAKQFHGFTMHTLDGNAGTIKETLFDEAAWVIRYLVVETGGWLDHNEILIASISVARLDWNRKAVYVNLTSEQIRESPGLGVTRPMLRANEAEFLDHYGYSHYWNGLAPVLPSSDASSAASASARRDAIERDLQQVASDLHSSVEMIGCAVRTSDDTDGQVEDLQFDDASWDIAFLVIDPHDWSADSSVLVSPSRVAHIDWEQAQVALPMTRAELEHCPKY
jgi:hypothetical protein